MLEWIRLNKELNKETRFIMEIAQIRQKIDENQKKLASFRRSL